ncbi:futalosine hydrolase [Marinicrinis lubricantis]|uniref:Futalosine hydrolase n=1 Tax=Marinicrinis lubricantis TaxID=2086470 RepID=A0ABW1IKQ9_9BACL
MKNSKSNALLGRGRILVMTAVAAERDAVCSGLMGDERFEVMLAGVGPASAAARTAFALSKGKYTAVISAGIGGGFAERADVGSVVIADEIVAADLGAETPEGFCSVDELGFGSSRIAVEEEWGNLFRGALKEALFPVHTGSVLTVSTATGTAETCQALLNRHPRAAAEAMEGYGVAAAAQDFGLPMIEIRAISNVVGPRDRDAWRIPEALDKLKAAFSIISEVSS